MVLCDSIQYSERRKLQKEIRGRKKKGESITPYHPSIRKGKRGQKRRTYTTYMKEID